MKRIILVTALLLGSAAAAYADTDTWTSNPPRSDAELAAAANSCSHQFGAPRTALRPAPRTNAAWRAWAGSSRAPSATTPGSTTAA
jgi:hypothetical protein